MPRARPLPVSGPAESTHAADAGGPAGRPGQRAAAATRGVIPSERADVLRLRSLLPLGRVELDLLVLIQRPVAGARDRGEVHEHVRRPVIGGDETKALIGVEPLHCSCCHQSTSSVRHDATSPRQPRAYLSRLPLPVHISPIFRGTVRRASPTPPPASMHWSPWSEVDVGATAPPQPRTR